MAVAWVQRTLSTSSGLVDSYTPTMPAGIVSGNLLVMAILVYAPSNGTINTPSGWTLQAADTGMGFSSQCKGYVFTKVAGASNPAPGLTGSISNIQVEISEVGGAGTVVGASGTPASTPVATPSSTASDANSLVVYLAFENTSTPSWTAYPAGTTSRYDENAGGGVSFCQVWRDKTVAAGAVATSSFTRSGTYNAVAHTLVIAPASGGGGGGGGGAILERKAGSASVDTDDYNALVDAVVALGGAVSTRKAGSGQVTTADFNAVVDAVVTLGGTVRDRKAGAAAVDSDDFNAVVDAVKLLGAP